MEDVQFLQLDTPRAGGTGKIFIYLYARLLPQGPVCADYSQAGQASVHQSGVSPVTHTAVTASGSPLE